MVGEVSMAAARVLHVGDDLCHRIPVIEMSGIVVFRSESSAAGLRTSLMKGDLFSALTFQNDMRPPEDVVVSTARELCRAPLILLRNPMIECDERRFDLVIDVEEPPAVWSKTLKQVIEESRRIGEFSRKLRGECEVMRDWSRSLTEMLRRNQVSPIDYDALFRGEPDDEDRS